MDMLTKLKTINEHMYLEPAEEVGTGVKRAAPTIAPCGVPIHKSSKQESLGIYQAQMGGGKVAPMLKTMLTTACERDCHYCPFRAGRNYRRTTFKPEEMAKSFMQIQAAGMADGIFLSSGIIKGGATTQDKLIDTIDILRNKHHFKGYVHLKVMPGAERDQVARAMQLADRLSINLEAPTVEHLRFLAPMKDLVDELFQPLKWVEEIRHTQHQRNGWNGRWPSTVTQFVVGAAGDNDLEMLNASQYLYRKLRLRRTYFSAFRPIRDTPLEHLPAENPTREHRLYQASFLLRDYGWDIEDMPFNQDGKLPLDVDPKLGWAKENLLEQPVEVNRATKKELLRVPGIGPKGAQTIIGARRRGKLKELNHLRKIGVGTKRLEDYVLLDGKRPIRQMKMF